MNKLFKVFVWAVPLLFLWLLICYGLYPATHRDYVIDFPNMLLRANGAFDKTLYTWWQDSSSSLTSDFYNAIGSWETAFSNFGVGGWWTQVIDYMKALFTCLSFVFAMVGKILFYYPFTFLYYLVSFIANLFDIIFNPSFINVGQYYKDEWSFNDFFYLHL